MAKYYADGNYVVVEPGDTLSAIARDYKEQSGGKTYQEIGALNGITNYDKIYVDQKIYLTKDNSSSGTSKSQTQATITAFGVQSNNTGTLFATWAWDKEETENYEVWWDWDTGDVDKDGKTIWFKNGGTSTVEEKQSTFSIPSNAKRVRFFVKPISKKKKEGDKEVSHWTAKWSKEKVWYNNTPLTIPSAPKIEIEGNTLTASLDGIDIPGASCISFEVVKNNGTTAYKKGDSKIINGEAGFSWTVEAGAKYKARCYAYGQKKNGYWSDWSDWSETKSSMLVPVKEITSISAVADKDTPGIINVYLIWTQVSAADSYEIQYTTDPVNFDIASEVQTASIRTQNAMTIKGLEAGREYWFRVRPVSDDSSVTESDWCTPKSVIVGAKPVPPTTWSSTSTAKIGDNIVLYWVHNSQDNSSQTFAWVEIVIDGKRQVIEIQNHTDVDRKNDTRSCILHTDAGSDGKMYVTWDWNGREEVKKLDYTNASHSDGFSFTWAVSTAGIDKNKYSDYSSPREITVYAEPTVGLELKGAGVRDVDGRYHEVSALPITISATPYPPEQTPIGYHISIAANTGYETSDDAGNVKMVSPGDEVYARYIDIKGKLETEISGGDITLENNIEYTLTCTVSMNSGLTASESLMFVVYWEDPLYLPNAEIGINRADLTATIRPYCIEEGVEYREVKYQSGGIYVETGKTSRFVSDPKRYSNATITVDGVTYPIYHGYMPNGSGGQTARGEIFYIYHGIVSVTDVYLSVYRREYDGSLTLIAADIPGDRNLAVTDPHPALDYARYRVVAKHLETGAVSYYDLPGVPINDTAVIIQWDEAWTDFETTESASRSQPEWTGSMLKLPYNIDVSDNTDPQVELIEYLGRKHPVSYYGTHQKQTATWNVVIDKSDKETVYALRRLAIWMGDVYVREPSGTGYWANVKVSFSQNYNELTIPVTLSLTRVEGGI